MNAIEIQKQQLQDPKNLIEENIEAVVVWFDDRLGYGFARRKDNGVDVQVHFRNIQSNEFHRTLRAEQKIVFNVEHTARGQRARNIVLNEKVGEHGNADKIQ